MIFAELKTAPTGLFQFVGDGELRAREGELFLFDGERILFTGDNQSVSLQEAGHIFSDFSRINQITS
jgi:hypothetical protein